MSPRRHRHGAVKQPSRKDLRGRAQHPAKKVVGAPPAVVNASLGLTPALRSYYYQASTTQCVTHSTDELLSHYYKKFFHTGWGFYRAQERDGIPGEAGTTTDAMLRVVRDLGNVVVEGVSTAPLQDDPSALVSPEFSIDGFHWLSRDPTAALDEVRAAFALPRPLGVLFASPWYQTFDDDPLRFDPDAEWGTPDGMWHQYLIDGAFDDRKVVTTPNSWGWDRSHELSYAGFMRLVSERGYGAIVTMSGEPGPPQPEPEPDPEPKKYQCRYCSKTFATKDKRKRHEKRRHSR